MSTSLDIATLSKAYAEGALTPEALIADVYKRIAAYGEKPVWISLVPQEVALEKARAAPRGPLYGIPFAVKDNIDVAGVPTTCACPDFAYTPERSARVVELLEAAGAIPIGKTNLDQFATGLNGTRSPYGIPACVFNKDYVSGGSSSGSAVAVAAGLVSFALGTDTAGSGRVPAAFNNLAGLKPTKGTLSATGLVPACRSLDTISIFALTAGDAWSVYDVAAAYDDADAFSRARPPLPHSSSAPLRIGIPAGEIDFCGDEDARALYHAGLERAKALGAGIVTFDFAPFRECAALLYQGPWVAERYAAIKEFADASPEAIHEVVRGIMLGAKNFSAADTFSGLYRLAELMRQAEREWQKMDMMLLPSAPTIYTIADMLADPVKLNSNLGLYTNFVNLMDLSALAVPAGFTPAGLPFGVTLVGRAFGDAALARFGDALHRALAGAKLGATQQPLAETPVARVAATKPALSLAVVGAHLSGQPLNGQLVERNARLVRTARTAKGYSFYALANTTPPKPGLVFDGRGAGGIEVEIWEMDEAAFGSFVAMIPAPLGIGTLALDDGSSVQGFVCEAHAIAGAKDITAQGGWRVYLNAG
jgi:allophanate hydrolase